MQNDLTPKRILEIGLAFQMAKVLLSAVELGLFTLLASGPMTREQISARLDLTMTRPRMIGDWLDALVSMDFLLRRGEQYLNSPAAYLYLVEGKDDYPGDMLGMANARMYPAWGNLTQALRTGGGAWFETMQRDPQQLGKFLKGMRGRSAGISRYIAELPWWRLCSTVGDAGCAEGATLARIASHNQHLTGWGLDHPEVAPHFAEYIAARDLADRIHFVPGDFFKQPLPKADAIILGRVLHDWDWEKKMQLLKNAYDALPKDGMLIVYDVLIDNERRENTHALLTSLNIALDTSGGFDYTPTECIGWMQQAGFRDFQVYLPTYLAEGVIVATK